MSVKPMTSAAIDNTLLLDAIAYALTSTSSRPVRIGRDGPSFGPSATGKASFLELLHTLLVYDRMELGYGISALYMFDDALHQFLYKLFGTTDGVIHLADDKTSCYRYGRDYPDHFNLRPVLDFVVSSADININRELLGLTFPPRYIESTRNYSEHIMSEWSVATELVAPFMFAARGVAYVSTVLGSNMHGESQFRRVYLAAPARLEAMKPFLAAAALSQQKRLHTGYLALVQSLRSLPETGFDFSVFKQGSSTHLLTSLSSALSGQSPSEAIATVMRLRKTDEGEQLRQEWRKDICSGSATPVVGHASQSVANCDIAGDIIQTIHIHFADKN